MRRDAKKQVSDYASIYDHTEEALVIGTILSVADAYHKTAHILNADCFHNNLHRRIYEAAGECVRSGIVPDIIMVKSKLDAKGEPYDFAAFIQLTSNYTPDLDQHSCRLKDLAVRRQLHTISLELAQASSNEAEDTEAVISRLINQLTDGIKTDDGIRTMEDNLNDVYTAMLDNLNGKPKGTPTGFIELDKRGGLYPTDLIVIAADSSQGKTSIALNIALNAAIDGHPSAIYSMEMGGDQLAARMLGSITGVSGTRILRTPLQDTEFKQVEAGFSPLMRLPIYTDVRSNSSIDDIILSIRSLHIRKGIKGAIVDYMQILSTNTKYSNPEAVLADIARKLKNIAKELKIWIIALSQLNREKATDNPEPSAFRLRGSGQINEAADVTMTIYRPEVYKRNFPAPYERYDTAGLALCQVHKGRNWGVFDFFIKFDANTQKFTDMINQPSISASAQEEAPF